MSRRDAYEAKAASEFGRVQIEISAVAARAQHAVVIARAKGERAIQAAQSKHDEALHRFELLKRAGDDTWNALKKSFEIAWVELTRLLGQKG
jgi:hypothetical protein